MRQIFHNNNNNICLFMRLLLGWWLCRMSLHYYETKRAVIWKWHQCYRKMENFCLSNNLFVSHPPSPDFSVLTIMWKIATDFRL